MWAPVITRLARHHRVVAPDVPGLGQSAPVPHLDVDTFGHWLTGVAEHTSLERPTVVAHSLVGSLTARLATRGSSAIGRLIVYAAPAVGPYRMPLRLRYVAIRFAIRPTPRNAERFDRFALFDLDATRRRDPDWYDAFDDLHPRPVPAIAREEDDAATHRRPRPNPSRTSSSTASTFAPRCCGAATTAWCPLAVGEAAASRHGWPLHVIDHAAHAPHIEQPEAFVDTLTAILSLA